MNRIISIGGAGGRKKRRGVPPEAPAPGYPAWRAGKTVGQVYTIANTASFNGIVDELKSRTGSAFWDMRDGWVGFLLDEGNSRWLCVNGGGSTAQCNNDWNNPIFKFNFWADSPQWEVIDWGTGTLGEVTLNRFYRDGRPISRHTYDATVYFGPGKMSDGKERVAHVGAYATMNNQGATLTTLCGYPREPNEDGGPGYSGGEGFELCLLNPSDWFAHNGFDNNGNQFNGAVHGWETNFSSICPAVNPAPGASGGELLVTIAQDPSSHDLWCGGSGAVGTSGLWFYDASTGLWNGTASQPLMTQTQQPNFRGGQGAACVFDRVRNKIVTIWPGNLEPGYDGVPRLILTTPSAPYTTTVVNLSNYGPQTGAAIGLKAATIRLVHDLDNDRYLVYTFGDNQDPYFSANYPPVLWAINPTTGACSVVWYSTAGTNVANNYNVNFLPDLHCIVWLDRSDQAIKFMPTA